MITSGNDKVVAIWDINKLRKNQPRSVTTTSSLHSSGIFSMHYKEANLITASKVLLHLLDFGLIIGRTLVLSTPKSERAT